MENIYLKFPMILIRIELSGRSEQLSELSYQKISFLIN